MKLNEYEIAIPITGWQVVAVRATTADEAAKKILSDNYCYQCGEFDRIELDLDTDNWET